MTVETVNVCTCGLVFFDEDDYDTLGSDSGLCCPDCGNEKFQTIADMQAELKKHCWIPVEESPPKPNKEWIIFINPEMPFGSIGGICMATFTNVEHIRRNYTHWKPVILPKKEK